MHRRSLTPLKKRVSDLFYTQSKKSKRFNRLLILLNIAVFGIFFLESLYPEHPGIHVLEILFGSAFLIEYLARLWIARRKWAFVTNIFSIVDLLVLVSLFAPLFIGNLALLRILRSLKVLRAYYVANLVKKQSKTVAQYHATIINILNFFVFLAIMTAIVFVAEAQFNPEINTYLDALYFTVATLTTTGYGDVTVAGPWGKILSVAAMLIGITLFLRLTRTIFRGSKLHHTCRECGLTTHDIDAIHCKHCGTPIKHRHPSHS